MRRTMVSNKRAELKALPRRELIDRICSFSDQNLLNFEADGKKREYPVGKMAEGIRDRGYQMSDNQYYTLVHHFALDTIPNLKIVGVTFRDNDPRVFEKELISDDKKGLQVYETTYTLMPEPENPHDANAVKVLSTLTDGSLHHVGYLPRAFVEAHPITESMEITGNILDYSNGKFKMVSYQTALDTEALDAMQTSSLLLSDADLQGIGELYPGPEHPRDGFVYELPFQTAGTVTDREAASAYVGALGMAEDMAAEFTTRGFPDTIQSMEWNFSDTHSGVVRMTVSEPLSAGQQEVADAFVHYLHQDGYLATHLRDQPFVQIGQTQDMFQPSRHGFRETSPPLLDRQLLDAVERDIKNEQQTAL